MSDLKLIWDFVSQHYTAFTFIGTPIAILIPLGRQWIRSYYAHRDSELRYQETKEKCKTKVEIERIRAGIVEPLKSNNSNLRIDKDSS